MNDQIPMRELNGGANLKKKFQSFQRIEFVFIAIASDGGAFYVLQDEIRPSLVVPPSIIRAIFG